MSGYHLTNNFHVDLGSVFPSSIAHNDRVAALVLSLGPLYGEDTVSLGTLHMDPPIPLCDHLDQQDKRGVVHRTTIEALFWRVPQQIIYRRVFNCPIALALETNRHSLLVHTVG